MYSMIMMVFKKNMSYNNPFLKLMTENIRPYNSFNIFFLHFLIKVLFCQCFFFWVKNFKMSICGVGDI